MTANIFFAVIISFIKNGELLTKILVLFKTFEQSEKYQ